MLGLESPCKRDCPNRSAECKKICEKWKEYEKAYFERDEEKAKAKAREQELDYYSFHREQMAKGIIYKRVKK